MTDGAWEKALSIYTQAQPTTREQVAGSGEGHASWYQGHQTVPAGFGGDGPPGDWDLKFSIPWFADGGEGVVLTYYYQLGLTLTRDVGSNDSGTPLSKFVKEPVDWLYPAMTDTGNDTVKLFSFDSAGMAARGVHELLEATQRTIAGWAARLDVPESELQGSAAGTLKDALTGIGNEFEDLAVQMTTPHEFSADIDRARSTLRDSTMELARSYEAWRNSPAAWPARHMTELFLGSYIRLLLSAPLLGDAGQPPAFLDPEYGDPATQEYWDRLEDAAKNKWREGVATALDPVASREVDELNKAYTTASSAIPGIVKPHWRTPNSARGSGSDPYGTGSGAEAAAKAEKAAQDAAAKAAASAGADGEPPEGGSAQDAAAAAADAAQEQLGDAGQDAFNALASNTGDGAGAGAEGDGTDAGGGIDQDAVNAARDKALQDAQNSAGGGFFGTGQDGGGTTGDTDTDTGGGYYTGTLPPGATVTGNGTVVGSDGKPLKNADGSTMKVSPSAAREAQLRQAQNARTKSLQDAAAQEEKAYQRQLQQQREAEAQSAAGRRAQEQSLARARAGTRTSSLDLDALERTRNAGAGFRVKQPDGSYAEVGKSTARAAEEAARAGQATRVRTSSAGTGGAGAGALAAEEAAAGRRTSSASSSGMPPPMGGGMGAAGGANGQDRERKSFLDEDEETWGTRGTSGTGVIG